jgi:hypothetical protein
MDVVNNFYAPISFEDKKTETVQEIVITSDRLFEVWYVA